VRTSHHYLLLTAYFVSADLDKSNLTSRIRGAVIIFGSEFRIQTPMVTAEQVDRPPGGGWNAKGALNLPDAWFLIDKHLPLDFPMSTAMFVTIFFEETACCNILQQGTPAAIGPGQLQVSEDGKVEFFANKDPLKNNFMGGKWDSSRTILAVNQATGKVFRRAERLHPDLPIELTVALILGDNEFSVKMHVKFMQWLWRGFGQNAKAMGLDGLLAAQTGGGANIGARSAFKNGSKALDLLMARDFSVNSKWADAEWKKYYTTRRQVFITALNTARSQFRGNPVPNSFVKFWEFFVPDDFLQDPLGYIRCGF
jgi:hypothetical protein